MCKSIPDCQCASKSSAISLVSTWNCNMMGYSTFTVEAKFPYIVGTSPPFPVRTRHHLLVQFERFCYCFKQMPKEPRRWQPLTKGYRALTPPVLTRTNWERANCREVYAKTVICFTLKCASGSSLRIFFVNKAVWYLLGRFRGRAQHTNTFICRSPSHRKFLACTYFGTLYSHPVHFPWIGEDVQAEILVPCSFCG